MRINGYDVTPIIIFMARPFIIADANSMFKLFKIKYKSIVLYILFLQVILPNKNSMLQ